MNRIAINLELNRMFIEQRLAESIAENLRREPTYDVTTYYTLCKDVLLDAGLDAELVSAMMYAVVAEAYRLHENYCCTGDYTYHNGSGQHPQLLISKSAIDFCKLIRFFDEQMQAQKGATYTERTYAII